MDVLAAVAARASAVLEVAAHVLQAEIRRRRRVHRAIWRRQLVAAGGGAAARREGRRARWCAGQKCIKIAGRPVHDADAGRRGRRRCTDRRRGSHLGASRRAGGRTCLSLDRRQPRRRLDVHGHENQIRERVVWRSYMTSHISTL